MKKIRKLVKVLKSKEFEMRSLDFSLRMKKIGKVLKVLKSKSFEISFLSFLGRMKKNWKASPTNEEQIF